MSRTTHQEIKRRKPKEYHRAEKGGHVNLLKDSTEAFEELIEDERDDHAEDPK